MTLTQFYMGLAMQGLVMREETDKLFNNNIIALADVAKVSRVIAQLTTAEARRVRFMELDAELDKLQLNSIYVAGALSPVEGYIQAIDDIREIITASLVPK